MCPFVLYFLLSDRPPVFASRAPQQPPPVAHPPQIQQYAYNAAQPTPMPPYPPAGGATPYPPVSSSNTPYPPPPGGGTYPPYPTPNAGSATPYPPAYPPAAGSTGYPPYPQGVNQQQRNEDSNTGTITSEHIKVNTYICVLCPNYRPRTSGYNYTA